MQLKTTAVIPTECPPSPQKTLSGRQRETFWRLLFSQSLISTQRRQTLIQNYEGRCVTDTNKHRQRPQIPTCHPASWVAAEHLPCASLSKHRGNPCKGEKKLQPGPYFLPVFFLKKMLQDGGDSETLLYAACCCGSLGLRPQLSGGWGLLHLDSTKAAGCNSKIIASSTVSRKTPSDCHVHRSSLQGRQLNQHF